MTNKEYKNRLQEIETFDMYDWLSQKETYALKKDLKQSNGVILPGSNFKASVRREDGWFILRSYYTDVAMTNFEEIVKLWDGYSATTMKHINEFCKMFGLPHMSKKDWVALPYEAV